MNRCDWCGGADARRCDYLAGDVLYFCHVVCEADFWGGTLPALR